MAASDPTERSELARLAALSRWSKTPDRTAATQAARDAYRAQFDPGPGVPEPQRTEMMDAGVSANLIRARRARRKSAQRKRELELADALAALEAEEPA